MLKRKVIMAIADGLGDRPSDILDNKTPLEYAKTPTLDRLAEQGITGMMDLISPGIPVGTDMGHLILFGYKPENYPGRGPIEARGIGMNVKDSDIVIRCNFATVDENGFIVDRRAGRIREGAQELSEALNGINLGNGVQALFQTATEHRAVLILRGEGLSDQVSDTDPHAPNDGKPYALAEPLDDSLEAKKTAKALNVFLEKAHEILSNHPINEERIREGKLPANFTLTRGAGKNIELAPPGLKAGFTGSCIAGERTVLGVANLAGYQLFTDDSMTGNMDTNIALKADKALELIKVSDIVYVHLKAPDIKGHDNEPFEKAEAIELFDQLVERIADNLPNDVYLALGADHSTPCEFGEHSGEPVPVVIYGPNIRRDQVTTYSEIDCAQGGLGRMNGQQFIATLHDLMGYSIKQGN
ncbi:2,3-bisphosphoglycerate-independent phosphoglycerate mutase [Pseudogracilibacillus sp. SE30717A]|uniref:2,3-bisphosphoglycerate-independent phosphoglycerate mutase n=1 Tax=Pseudogracilibacillus sp. SE30717A TaxID=3098293 RepID=UPI00300E31EC